MTTRTRVPEHTSRESNVRIKENIADRLEYYAEHPNEIEQRLLELDREWDIERTLETNAATLSLLGLTLGFAHHRRWFLLPLAVQTFLLQHALQGWCPPLPFFRARGVRTLDEINYERYALKTLRGDFAKIHPSTEGNLTASATDELMTAVMQ